jgi:hypothetical protein
MRIMEAVEKQQESEDIWEIYHCALECFEAIMNKSEDETGEICLFVSPGHIIIIDTNLRLKFFSKKYFFSFIKHCSKINKNHLQKLRKTISCNILPVLNQNDILKEKKKYQNLLKIAEIFAF